MRKMSIYEHPHLIALVIVLVCGRTLGIGTGAVLAAWYCACVSNASPWPVD